MSRNWKWLGLLVSVMVVFVSVSAFAQEAGAAAGVLGDEVKKWLGIAAGFGLAAASIGGAFGQSRAIAAAVTGIARNPGAAKSIFAPTLILGLVFIESLVLYTFVIAIMLTGKI